MSVHHIHKTHQDELNNLAKKYLKKWFKIKKNGVTEVSIFHPYMLGIKNPSQLYKEAHAGSYTMIRIKGDEIVNYALYSRLERELTWKNKSSSIVEAEKVFQENLTGNNITLPTTETVAEREALITKAKKEGLNLIKNTPLQCGTKK